MIAMAQGPKKLNNFCFDITPNTLLSWQVQAVEGIIPDRSVSMDTGLLSAQWS